MSRAYNTPAHASALSTALARNRLGTVDVGMAIASSIAPLTVTAALIPVMLGLTGLLAIPVAVLAVAAVFLLFSVGYIAMARHIPNAGAFYAYAARGIGRPVGVGVAWVALCTYLAFQIGSLSGFGAIGAPLLEQVAGRSVSWMGPTLLWVVLALAAWLLVAVLGVLDVKVPARVMVVLVAAETVLVCGYAVAIVLSGSFSFSAAPLQVDALWAPGAGALIVVAATAFAGFEQGAVYVEEARGRATVARATVGTVSLLAVLYFLVSWVLISAAGAQVVERAAAEGTDLFFNQAATVLGQGALWGGRVLVLTSVLAAAVAFSNAVSRYAFALGREGVLPRILGRTSAAGVPRNASLAVSAAGLLVILVWAIAGWDPLVTLFFWAGTSGGLGVLLLITTTSVSVICYFARHRHHESGWRTCAAPVMAALLLAVISTLAIDNLPALYGVEGRSGPAIAVPIAFLAVLAAGIAWGLILKARQPHVYEGIGYGTRAATAGATGLTALIGQDATSPSMRTGAHR